jgi:Meckel syndrome type 1 protein
MARRRRTRLSRARAKKRPDEEKAREATPAAKEPAAEEALPVLEVVEAESTPAPKPAPKAVPKAVPKPVPPAAPKAAPAKPARAETPAAAVPITPVAPKVAQPAPAAPVAPKVAQPAPAAPVAPKGPKPAPAAPVAPKVAQPAPAAPVAPKVAQPAPAAPAEPVVKPVEAVLKPNAPPPPSRAPKLTPEAKPVTPPPAAPAQPAQPQDARQVSSRSKAARVKIGKALLEEGLVSQEDLRAVAQAGSEIDRKWVDKIVSQGVISCEKLASLLGAAYRASKVHIAEGSLPSDAVMTVPALVARECVAVPLRKLGNILCVASPDPYDVAVIAKLREATGLKIKMFEAPEEDVKRAIAHVYGGSTLQ